MVSSFMHELSRDLIRTNGKWIVLDITIVGSIALASDHMQLLYSKARLVSLRAGSGNETKARLPKD